LPPLPATIVMKAAAIARLWIVLSKSATTLADRKQVPRFRISHGRRRFIESRTDSCTEA
jgi:hypothetical protein